jgi:SAM-dependent methyltransferase
MSNTQLFSTLACEYSLFRPGYPPELFEWLAHTASTRDAAWDCGCGNGQASVPLAAHFSRVFATDSAAEQIAAAKPHPRVSYAVAPAEHSGLPGASVDLVTVAQALHWFDVEAFYAEARRVARPGALLAAWTYPRPEFIDAELDRRFLDFYTGVVGPHWPPERRHVEANYTTLPFPFAEIPHPSFALELRWNLEQVLGYVSSWSATSRYRKTEGRDPLPRLRTALAPLWPDAGRELSVRMRIVLRAGRLRAAGAEAG